MPIKTQFTITFSDYLKAQNLHNTRHWWKRLVDITNRRILPASGVLLVIGGIVVVIDGKPWKSLGIIIGCGLFLMSYPMIARSYLGYCYRRTRSGTGECELEFSPESIQTRTTHSKDELMWPAIRSFAEDRASFLLYIAPAKFFVIPKRVCSEEQQNELRALFQDKVTSHISHKSQVAVGE